LFFLFAEKQSGESPALRDVADAERHRSPELLPASTIESIDTCQDDIKRCIQIPLASKYGKNTSLGLSKDAFHYFPTQSTLQDHQFKHRIDKYSTSESITSWANNMRIPEAE
jgi:hypothetical protein